MHTKKGSLGVPRTLWVLTPSLCVTNPLTCNLWHFISFDLKTSYFLGFVRTFLLSLGNNKSAVATIAIYLRKKQPAKEKDRRVATALLLFPREKGKSTNKTQK